MRYSVDGGEPGLSKLNRVVLSKQSCVGGQKRYTEYHYPTNRLSRTDAGPPGYIISGPYISLTAGLYEAMFTVELKGETRPEKIASFDVCTHRGHYILNSRIMGAADFSAGESHKSFSLFFELEGATPNIETRVFSYHSVDFVIKDILIRTTRDLKHLWQGRTLAAKGFYQQALSHLLQIKPEKPYLYVVYKERAKTYQTMGREREALENYRQYHAVRPGDRGATQQYGELLLKTEQRQEGIRILQQLQGL